MNEEKKCKGCKKDKKIQARGQCRNCYDRWLKKKDPSYRKRQLYNSQKWVKENPIKVAEHQKRKRDKEKLDPMFKIKTFSKRIKRQYGLSYTKYLLMLRKQGGRCKICRLPPNIGKRLHIDHCHDTGKIRGLLCAQCNWYVGKVDKDVRLLSRMFQHVSKR